MNFSAYIVAKLPIKQNQALGMIKCNFKYVHVHKVFYDIIQNTCSATSGVATVPQFGIPTIVKTSTHLKKFREKPQSLFDLQL